MENSNQTKIFFKLALSEKFYHSFEQCLRRGIDLNYLCRGNEKKSSCEIVILAVELTKITDFEYKFPIDRIFKEIDKRLRDKKALIEGNFAISNHYNGYLNKGFIAPIWSLVENGISKKEEAELQKLLDSIIDKYTKNNIWYPNNTIKASITITKQEEDDFQRHNKLSERLTDWVNQLLNNQSQPLNATE